MNGSGLGGRTPQRPPPGGTISPSASEARSRSSTPTTADVASTSPLVGDRANSLTKNNNTRSPRTPPSTRKSSTPSNDAPETDEDRQAVDSPQSEWLRQSEEALATMDKQIHDAAKRNKKNQMRCSTMRDAMSGKEERMDALRGTYASLSRELEQLNLLSSDEDLDPEVLNDMFMTIPTEERCFSTE